MVVVVVFIVLFITSAADTVAIVRDTVFATTLKITRL